MHRIITTLVAIGAASVIGASPVSAAGWTEPVRVDPMAVSGEPDGPSIAVHDGRLYIAVAADGIVVLTNRSGEWQRIRVTRQWDGHPSLAVDADGRIHLAFTRTASQGACTGMGCVPDALWYATDRSGHWRLTKVARGGAYLPSIALTDTGRPRIAWLGAETIRLSRLLPGGWSTKTVGRDAENGLPRAGGPRLALDGTRSYVAYHGYTDPTHGFLRLVEVEGDRVVRWSRISFDRRATNPDLVVDLEGRVHVAFTLWCKGLWYAKREADGTWTRRQIAPQVAFEYRPSIALVGDGHVAVVAEQGKTTVCSAGGSGAIIFRTNRTGYWTGELLTGHSADYWVEDQLPSIVVGGGKARVVYLHRTWGQHQIRMTKER